MDNTKNIDRIDIIERIAHMISGGNLPNEVFEHYFGSTQIGFMNQKELEELLKGENK